MPARPTSVTDARFNESVVSCMQRLERMGAHVVALGQTVFWDEPMKAVACTALQRYAPSATFTAAVHDTDYFSKLPGHRGGTGDDRGFAILPHDEGATKELWAAIGEASALFGSEAPVSKSDLIDAGVPLRWLSRRYDDGVDAFYRRFTQAYGWRGIVSRTNDSRVACDIETGEVADALCELLSWALAETAESLTDDTAQAAVRSVERELVEAVRREERRAAGGSLTGAYVNLLPEFFATLLNGRPNDLRLSSSTRIFRFNARTCRLPRFDFLDCFLSPGHGNDCRECYDEAVRGTGIYALDQFGEDAIPFDVVVPGLGRGTIHVGRTAVAFDFPEGTRERATARTVEDRGGLAAAIESEFGGDACLVGKAAVLPLMLSREWCMLLHQGASVYVPRTRRLARMLREHGIQAELHPILRIHYATWDSLDAVNVELALPPHLARVFGRDVIHSTEFAERWDAAMSDARQLIRELARTRKPSELVARLPNGSERARLAAQYESAAQRRRESARPIQKLLDRNSAELLQLERLRAENAALHRRRGAIRRERILPTRRRLWELHTGEAEAAARAAALERLADAEAARDSVSEELAVADSELRAARSEQARIREELLAVVRSNAHRDAMKAHRDAVLALEFARLDAVADASRALALERADHRPSWWWFPAVDPSGAWFVRAMETATMRFEEFTD